MTENKKNQFPRTPDGVTDWELTFEAADNGLIPLIRQATTTTALFSCATIVISKLFVRKNDQLEVIRLTAQLQKLFAEERASPNFEKLSNSVVELLREIKNERIHKAQLYLAKKSAKNKKNKRSESLGQRLTKIAYHLVKDPKYLILTIVMLLVVLTGIVVAGVGVFMDGPRSQTPKIETPREEPATPDADLPETEDRKKTNEKSTPEQPDEAKKPKMPPAIVLRRIILSNATGNEAKGVRHLMPILVLENPVEVSAVCDLQPIIFDAVNMRVRKIQTGKTELSTANLGAISAKVMSLLNTRLKRKAIVRMLLVPNVDLKDHAGSNCALAPPKFKKYLN